MRDLVWECLPFAELDTQRLYAILAARQEVFVLEQGLRYPDCDSKDPVSWHLMAWERRPDGQRELAAYLRIVPPGVKYPELSVGRVLTRPAYRGRGYGKALMHELLFVLRTRFAPVRVTMGAQAYLQAFYEAFGFQREGEPFTEADIDHVRMSRTVS